MCNCFSFKAVFYDKRKCETNEYACPVWVSPIHRVSSQMRPSWSQERPRPVGMATPAPNRSCNIHADLLFVWLWPSRGPCASPSGLCKVLGPHTGVSPLTLSRHSNLTQPHAASFSFNKCQHATGSSVGAGERNMICFRERRMEKMTSLWRKRVCVCVSDFEMVEEIIISNHTCYAAFRLCE